MVDLKKSHKLFFFLDDFHHGVVNHLTHFVGFTLLGYGLGKPSLVLIILSPIIMESGHLYNFAQGKHKKETIQLIPIQLLTWFIFVGIGYFIAKY